jgi:ribosomal protein S27AE
MEQISVCPKCGYNKFKTPSTTNIEAVKHLKQCSRCGFVGKTKKEDNDKEEKDF